jgi:endo-1,3(4)-beta-glucanase
LRNKCSEYLQLFENKCDHATWFDSNFYAIQGIHMIPLIPSSALIRTKKFVQEEWDAYFGDSGAQPAKTVDNGWKSILYENLALIDPKASWSFFVQPGFNSAWLDDGASRTWSLAYAAGKSTFEYTGIITYNYYRSRWSTLALSSRRSSWRIFYI